MLDRQRLAMLVGIVAGAVGLGVGCDPTPSTPLALGDDPLSSSPAAPGLGLGLDQGGGGERELEPARMSGEMLTVPEVVAAPVQAGSGSKAGPELRTVAPRRPRKVVRGTVLAHGGGPIRDVTLEQFAALCGDGEMVLIPTAAEAAEYGTYRARARRPWLRWGIRDVVVLHARDREEADASFAEPLRQASCAWLSGGAQGRLEDRYVGTPVEQELHALLRRGGAVGGDSAGSAIMSRVMIHHGNPDPVEGTGFGILPGVIVDQHFLAREREPRLVTMLERHPELVGFGIDESTALVVHDGQWRVIGDSVVRRCTVDGGCADLPAGASGRFPDPPE